MTTQPKKGIPGNDDKWAYFRDKPFDYSNKLYYGSRGPWPTPAPGRPLSEVAEVANLPKEELDDWNKNVKPKYIIKLLLNIIPALYRAYFKYRGCYKKYTDDAYNHLFSNGMYSKFICELEDHDEENFPEFIDKIKKGTYRKLDFAGMEHICNRTYEGMYAAASMVLLEPIRTPTPDDCDDDAIRYRAVAIHLYSVDENNEKIKETARTYTPSSENKARRKWELAKYFSLQGAVHRINMTEHGRLHFPLDAVNAITKSIFPVNHPLFVLLMPHLRLSLAVDNSVLQGSQSLISRTNWTIYAPYVAAGKDVRKLIADGYVGRCDKEKAFPPYEFPFDPSKENTSFNIYLRAYYEIFHEFVKNVLETALASEYLVGERQNDSGKLAQQEWEFIALWAECIREWIPGFMGRCDLNLENENDLVIPRFDKLVCTVAHIIWNVTVAHAADHQGFSECGAQGNIFRVRIPPPLGDTEVPENFEKHLVSSFDLFQSELTNILFYTPMNFVNLEDVTYDFETLDRDGETCDTLVEHAKEFMEKLRKCDEKQYQRDKEICRLKNVSSSIQY